MSLDGENLIQATYWFLSIRGEICHHYYFSEWDSIKEAIRFFSHHYTEPIFINQQTQFLSFRLYVWEKKIKKIKGDNRMIVYVKHKDKSIIVLLDGVSVGRIYNVRLGW